MQDAINLRAFGFDPIAHMNAARARKPASGGKTYAMPKPRYQRTADDVTRAILAWQSVCSDAIEQFRFDVFGDQWVGL